MVWTRYAFAATYCADKSVLEVACGPGPGLGCLRATSHTFVGGDYTASHLIEARAHYGTRIPLVRLDALSLPFPPRTFDVVLLFEALYFLGDFEVFVRGCRDVLRDGGLLLIASVNPEWSDFNPAPFSTRYLNAAELAHGLRAHGFEVALYAGFPAAPGGMRERFMGLAKRTAIKLHLMPKTMKGKEMLKRVAFGRLSAFPAEVSAATGTFREPVPLRSPEEVSNFKVIYAVARKKPD